MLTTLSLAPDFGNIVNPGFERRVIGKNQVGESAGLVDEAAEADDIRNLREGFAELKTRRRSENRIGVIEQQHLGRALPFEDRLREGANRRNVGLYIGC